MLAIDVYKGSDGELTRQYYAELEKRGPIGRIAMNLFRAQKCSERAKLYRGGIRGLGSFRRMAYERKSYAMDMLCQVLTADDGELQIGFGWKQDPKVIIRGDESWVLYIDLPQGQVSFHSSVRCAGPDYFRDWDGQRASVERILAFCDQVMEGQVIESMPAILPPPPNFGPSEKCSCGGALWTKKPRCKKCGGSRMVRRCLQCEGAGMFQSKPCGPCGGYGSVPA